MSVLKRGNVYWVDVYVKGKRHRFSTRQLDKRQAQIIEQEFVKKLMNGLYNAKPTDIPIDMTLEQAFERMLKEYWTGDKAIPSVISNINVIMEETGKELKLEEIDSRAIVVLLKRKLRERGNSDSSINRKLSTLHTTLKQACYIWKAIPVVPIIQWEKEAGGRMYVISPEEEKRIIEEAGKVAPIGAMVLIALFSTGARLSEILNLQWKDIDEKNRCLHIWTNKTDKPRTIPLSIDSIARYKQLKKGVEEFSPVEADSYLYPVNSNHMQLEADSYLYPVNSNHMQYVWSKVRQALGNTDPDFTIHAIRHTVASRLVRKGVSLYIVKEILGHKNISTTERYAHLNTDALNEALQKLHHVQ